MSYALKDIYIIFLYVVVSFFVLCCQIFWWCSPMLVLVFCFIVPMISHWCCGYVSASRCAIFFNALCFSFRGLPFCEECVACMNGCVGLFMIHCLPANKTVVELDCFCTIRTCYEIWGRKFLKKCWCFFHITQCKLAPDQKWRKEGKLHTRIIYIR